MVGVLQCILNLSDIQLVTGVAILISGYASLPCGLSAYHWQIIVYLAWFSSITHVSALTFLRNYLYNHQGERLWRFIAMSIFLILLIAAIVPTGSFNWQSGRRSDVRLSSYAICYFNTPSRNSSRAYGSMELSISLLVFSFVTRGIKIHKRASNFINNSVRNALSKKYRRFLQWLYSRSGDDNNPLHWTKTLLYRPALVIFLVVRLILDLYSSTLSEVS